MLIDRSARVRSVLRIVPPKVERFLKVILFLKAIRVKGSEVRKSIQFRQKNGASAPFYLIIIENGFN
ncbi:hypothetical protein VAL01S_05_01800 [Vibrio alginolyticus NBRC 15630 = ATCC 17749]|jgi:hypothetical protein|nr:hypothetical protein YZOS03_26750 [Vibrio alginolyticus]BCG16420.1 hypothetical protein HLBS07_02720 [Vibrio alginolyticus]GAD70602.1 hypothetical protein VAL01S_05_01800 [Vibrio alginolyticus NBRC 15630 = ATCC 17749]